MSRAGRLAAALATGGGVALLGTAGFVTASVVRRWVTGHPIPGDFELAALGGGLSVSALLAMGTAARANIVVDSFTRTLPARVTTRIDALWMAVWAACCLLLAERMAQGAAETWAAGITTMVLGVPTWWAVAAGAGGFAATGAVALGWAARLLRGHA